MLLRVGATLAGGGTCDAIDWHLSAALAEIAGRG